VTTNTYDNANRLTGISTMKGTTTILSITYTLDSVGNRLTMVEPSGTTSYTYDALNRLTAVTYPTGTPASVSYTYDAMSNRLTMVQDSVTTHYTYDAADHLTGTSGGSSLTFTWDNDGQMLTKGSQTFSWDALGRMTGLKNGGATASYNYNGDGVRVDRTVNDTTTADLQDLAGGLPVVLAETIGANTTQYVYGSDLIAQVNGSTPSYYHADGLGSTRAMTDSTGISTDQYTYDAFGAIRSHTGSSTNAYTYTGQQVDPESGLVFLRARYYDPQTALFLSKDPVVSTNNAYSYASDNPIRWIDPTGQFSCESAICYAGKNLLGGAVDFGGIVLDAAEASFAFSEGDYAGGVANGIQGINNIDKAFGQFGTMGTNLGLAIIGGPAETKVEAGAISYVIYGFGGMNAYKAYRGMVEGANIYGTASDLVNLPNAITEFGNSLSDFSLDPSTFNFVKTLDKEVDLLNGYIALNDVGNSGEGLTRILNQYPSLRDALYALSEGEYVTVPDYSGFFEGGDGSDNGSSQKCSGK
jgi:RHS repeat-associated protein